MDGCIRFAVIGWCLVAMTSSSGAVEPQSFPLPPSKVAAKSPVAVASLTFVEPDGSRIPVVEVWSNGQVRATELTGTAQNPTRTTRTDRLTSEEMVELYRLLSRDCRVPSLSSTSVREALQTASEQRQLTADIQGAAQTEVGMLVGNRWHAVNCPAVSILKTRFPDVTEVQNISAAQDRLQNIAAVALVGGGQIADHLADSATHKLHESHPDAGAITRRDLKMVRRLGNGTRFVQFQYAGGPGQNDACLVSVTQSPQGPIRMGVLDSPSVVR